MAKNPVVASLNVTQQVLAFFSLETSSIFSSGFDYYHLRNNYYSEIVALHEDQHGTRGAPLPSSENGRDQICYVLPFNSISLQKPLNTGMDIYSRITYTHNSWQMPAILNVSHLCRHVHLCWNFWNLWFLCCNTDIKKQLCYSRELWILTRSTKFFCPRNFLHVMTHLVAFLPDSN